MLQDKYVSASPALANYDYVDVINGLGYIEFYLTKSGTDAGAVYLLTPYALPPDGNVYWGDGGTTYTFIAAVFNTPRVVKGTAYLSGYLEKITGNPALVNIIVQKVSGSTTTNLNSAIQTTGFTASSQLLTPITLTETAFKAGDYIQITLQVYGTSARFYIDPISTAGNIPAKLLIPFKIEV
jgi:hypothetical protein